MRNDGQLKFEKCCGAGADAGSAGTAKGLKLESSPSHAESFDQLSDDAIFGVKKKAPPGLLSRDTCGLV
jgi:hypothetical protein